MQKAGRRFAQMIEFNLQAAAPLVLYALSMSDGYQALGPVGTIDFGTTSPACNHAPACTCIPGTWSIRRAVVRARRALLNMQLHEASKATAQLRRSIGALPQSVSAPYAHALRLLEAFVLVAEDDLTTARGVLLSADVGVRPGSRQEHDALAATVLRYIDWRNGDPASERAVDIADYLNVPVGGKAVCRILNLCVSAAVAFDRLQLVMAGNLATEALQLARTRYGNHSSMSTLPAALLAQVAYEQGHCDEAEALLRSRISIIRASGVLDCVARASVLLARLSLHRGRHRAALTLLRETEALGKARCWPRLVSIASMEYSRTIAALRYDHKRHAPTRETPAPLVPSIRRPRQPASCPAIDGLLFEHPVTFSGIESALRRASSAAALGSTSHSYELLIPCLRLGAARGLCMVFADAGPPILKLLERLYHSIPVSDLRLSELRPYIATLLRCSLQSSTEEPISSTCRSLSRRETGILQMIALGMSNKRIAQSLGITPETVKSHAKSIFVKLASRTRAQAVARAESVGFL
jgi:DNA-binding CsgD family transcriptional regulator